MKASTKMVISTLRKDKRYKRLLESFESAPLYNIAREELLDELRQIHELREIRRLNPREDGFVDKLISANTHDQAQRSRCVAIMMQCVNVTAKLVEATDSLKQHFLMEYSDQLRSFRTKEERSMVISTALKKFHKYVHEIDTLREVANLVVSDIDKAAWSLRNSVEALKVHHGREQKL